MNQTESSEPSDSNFSQYDFGESSGLRSDADPRSSRSGDLHLAESNSPRRREHDLHERHGSRRSSSAEEATLSLFLRFLLSRRRLEQTTTTNDISGSMSHVLPVRSRRGPKRSRIPVFCPCFSGNITESDSEDDFISFPMNEVLSTPLRQRLALAAEASHQTIIDRRHSNTDALVHRIIEYTHYLIPSVDKIYAACYYWGEMDRFKAESLLQGKPEGTFLLRDSAQSEYLFSVSFRRFQRTLHARIEQGRNLFSFDILDESVFSAPTVTQLIENYKDPSKCLFFEPQLSNPLPRNFVFSLQDLCRAVIATRTTYSNVSKLKLPQKQKAFIRELHYSVPIRTVLTSQD